MLLCAKGLSNDDVGVLRDTAVFQKIRPGASFKTGDSLKERYRRRTPDIGDGMQKLRGSQ